MKMRNFTFLAATILAASCGTSTYYSSSNIKDAVYDTDYTYTQNSTPKKQVSESPQLARLKEKTLILSKAESSAKMTDGADTIYFRIKDTLLTDSTMTFEELITKFDNPTYIINLELDDDYNQYYFYNPWWTNSMRYSIFGFPRSYFYSGFYYNPWYYPYYTYNPFWMYGGYNSIWYDNLYYGMYYGSNSWLMGMYYPWYYYYGYMGYPYSGYGYGYPGHYMNYYNHDGWTADEDYFHGKRSVDPQNPNKDSERSGGSYVRRGSERTVVTQTSGLVPDRTRMSTDNSSSVYRRGGNTMTTPAAGYQSAGTRSRYSSSTGQSTSYRKSEYNNTSDQRGNSYSRPASSSYQNGAATRTTSGSSNYNNTSGNTRSNSNSGSVAPASSSGSNSGGGASRSSSGGGSVYRR